MTKISTARAKLLLFSWDTSTPVMRHVCVMHTHGTSNDIQYRAIYSIIHVHNTCFIIYVCILIVRGYYFSSVRSIAHCRLYGMNLGEKSSLLQK